MTDLDERTATAHQVLATVGLRPHGTPTTPADLRTLADLYEGRGLITDPVWTRAARACRTAAHILDGADPDTAAILAALETP